MIYFNGLRPSSTFSLPLIKTFGYQQNLTGRRIAILELSTNDIRRIQAASVLIEEALATITPNEFKQLNIP